MFHCGFCKLVIHEDIQSIAGTILDMKQFCERVVLGIPDELTYARLYGDVPYSPQEKKELLFKKTKVDEVHILSDRDNYEHLYEQIHFDIVFYGAQFGKCFDQFSSFAAEKGIFLSSMMPDHFVEAGPVDAMKIALENLQRHQKIVLFGTGFYFDLYINNYGKRFPPSYAVDNSIEKQGTRKAGIEIYSPDKLLKEHTENILIIICAQEYEGILRQIKDLGDFDYRLMIYNNPVALLEEYELTREGELIYLEKAHAILAKMLKEFDRVCQKNQLHYYMICGSLIGVIRHKGFIPWDDDVDVAMPRKDYEKLQKIALEEWKDKPYRVLGFDQYGNGAFLDCMPRIVNMQERLPMKVYDKVLDRASADIVDRPFLDIYVMDNAFDNEKKHICNMNMMKGVYNLLMGHRGYVDYNEYRPVIPEKTIRTMKLLHTIGRYIPLKFLAWWYDHLSTKANGKECENYFMPSCAIRCIERKFKQDFFKVGLRKPFLDFEVTVPSDIDGLMEAMGYHGYMQFPRMSIRKPSHYFNSDIIIW